MQMAEFRAAVHKPRRPIACNFCRLKKIRCDGAKPCRNCVQHDEECLYAARRGGRPRKGDTNAVSERLARIEALLQSTENVSTSRSPKVQESRSSHSLSLRSEGQSQEFKITDMSSFSDQSQAAHQGSHRHNSPTHYPCSTSQSFALSLSPPVVDDLNKTTPSSGIPSLPLVLLEGERCLPSLEPGVSPRGQTSSVSNEIVKTTIASATRPRDEAEAMHCEALSTPEESSLYTGEMSNWEYHGPRTFMSICSNPGIQWIVDRSGQGNFADSAIAFTMNVTRRLKIETKLSEARTSEPSKEMATTFSKAYFEHAREAPFDIVDRTWFEARLKAHQRGSVSDDDPAWYALRNAIYATGARIEMAKTRSFRDAYQCAWSFFSNSLSVHTELLYFRTSLMAVQALTIMAYYCESIGNPCLEYMLSTIALRLAYSKGLHRRPIPSWNISEEEQIHRDNIFWANYCLEKNCTARSGRPSMVDDDLINCRVPEVNATTGSTPSSYAIALTRQAQLTSRIAKRLSEALTQPVEVLDRAMSDCSDSLSSLKDFLQQFVDFSSPVESCNLRHDLNLQQVIFIRMSYYIGIFDLHTTLTYPWSRRLLGPSACEILQTHIRNSTEIVASTARDAILSTQFLRMDATTSILVGFHGPMYALINLCIHILQDPTNTRAQSDLTLMEIGAAHFSRLEFTTGHEISFPFAKELVRLAQCAIEKAKASSSEFPADFWGDWGSTADPRLDPDVLGTEHGYALSMSGAHTKENYTSSLLDIDLEQCSTLVPTPWNDNYVSYPLGILESRAYRHHHAH